MAATQAWTPTTQQGGLYDWSRLAYNDGIPTTPSGSINDWGSRANITRDPFNWTGPEAWMHDPSMNDSQIANPDYDQAAYDRAKAEYEATPTFTAKRRTGAREGWNDDNKYWYENAGYKLETGPDGKQQLVQTRDWQVPGPEKSSWMQTGPDALKFLGTALAGGALGGVFGGAGAGAAAPGMSGLEWGALADSAAGATSGVFGGAAPGAATVGAGGVGAAAVDPIAAYLTTGGVEGSILGGGTGGAAGAVGPGTLSAQLAGGGSGLSGLFKDAVNLLGKPGVSQVIGSLLGGAFGGAASGDTGSGTGAAAKPMAPGAWRTPPPIQAANFSTPSGTPDLSNSAGVFADYMRQNMARKTPMFMAPRWEPVGQNNGVAEPIMSSGRVITPRQSMISGLFGR